MLQGIAARSSPIRQTAAESRETSVPQPSAIPTSLAARAGASLTPSPTMQTGPTVRRARSIAATLSAGSSAASTGTPSCSRDRPAARGVIAGEHGDVEPGAAPAIGSPPARRAATARRRRTARGPDRPSRRAPAAGPATRHPRRPRSVAARARARVRSRNRRLPSTIGEPDGSRRPTTPSPGTTRTSEISTPSCAAMSAVDEFRDGPRQGMRRGRGQRRGARQDRSTPRPGPRPRIARRPPTPVVSVPVLSNRTAATSASRSSASPLRNRTRWLAALPSALQTASGAASPRAHGQAISPTARPAQSPRSSEPKAQWIAKATTAIAVTAGTNTPAARSASR